MKSLVAALTIVALAVTTSPAFAAPGPHEGLHGGRGVSGGHPGAFEAHRGVGSHREFERRDHGRVFISVGPSFYWGPAYPFGWDAPAAAVYAPPPPSYWYYCPSAGAYYPYVSSCPEVWVPVPATVQ